MRAQKEGAFVFDLGKSLRAAREAQGLELAQVEAQTKIRARYLAAIEEERFGDLPSGYERSFLRTYAGVLGLESSRYLDEYASRFPDEEPPPRYLPPPRRRRFPSTGILIALACVAIVVAVVAAAHFGSRSSSPAPPLRGRAVTPPARPRSPRPVVVAPARPHAKPRPRQTRIAIRAVSGDCWISVRENSPAGRVLYERLLTRGGGLVVAARPRLWIRLGAPGNVDLAVSGRPSGPLGGSSPVNLLVDARGVHPTAPGYVPPSSRG